MERKKLSEQRPPNAATSPYRPPALLPSHGCPSLPSRRLLPLSFLPPPRRLSRYAVPLQAAPRRRIASPARVPSRSSSTAAASYGYGGDLLRPIDTQTIIIAAAVISAVSLSLVLGLKVSAAGISFFLLGSRLLASGCDLLCCLVAGGPGAVRPVRWK